MTYFYIGVFVGSFIGSFLTLLALGLGRTAHD